MCLDCGLRWVVTDAQPVGTCPVCTPAAGGPLLEPPLRCPVHAAAPATGPCPPCGDARRLHQAWEVAQLEQRRQADAQARARARQARADTDAQRAACRLCDADGTGVVDGQPIACTHQGLAERRRALAAQAEAREVAAAAAAQARERRRAEVLA